jgi:hypothetical protein
MAYRNFTKGVESSDEVSVTGTGTGTDTAVIPLMAHSGEDLNAEENVAV